jgi:hypothetical protein
MDIEMVRDTRYLGATLSKRLTWSKLINQMRKKAAQRLGTLGPLLNRRSGLSIKMAFCSISSSSVPWWTTRVLSGGPLPASTSRNWKYCSSGVFALLPVHPGTLVTGKFTWFESSLFLRPHQISNWQVRLQVSWCGEPTSWTAWQTPALSFDPETCQLARFRLPWLRFSVIFLSCKANSRVKLTRQGTARISKLGENIYAVSPLLILVWPLWVRIPESLPTKVAPPK